MRRLAIITGDFVATGGMDKANFALARYLAATGCQIDLVAHRVADSLAANPNVTVTNVTKPFQSYFLGQWGLARAGSRIARRVADVGGRVIVNGGNCRYGDVNWVHYVHAAFTPELVASPLRRMKSWVERPHNLRMERTALHSAKIVICNSELTRRHVVELVGVAPERTRVVYYGADASELSQVDDERRVAIRSALGLPIDRPVVCFVGALGDRRKGFDTLFSAWRSLSREANWDAVLVVIGAGAELNAWRERAAVENLASSCRFLGFRRDVPTLLPAFDLLVAPTRYEAYGLGVQEALCCGVPALVSAEAGVAEHYPAELRDLLLPMASDDMELKNRLQQWREDIEGTRQRARPLSERLRNHSWDEMSREIIAAMDLVPVANTRPVANASC